MTVTNSTRKKPAKPYPEFPLFAHQSGQWCRKIRGKLYYFGKWDNPTAALEKHNAEYAYLKEGITAPERFDGWRVGDLVNEFLSVQEDRLELGEIEQCTFDSLVYVGKLIVEFIPKHRAVESLKPSDFRELRSGLMKRFAPTNTRVNMSRIRSIFKFAYDEQLISKPVFYGRGFELPKKSTIRKARNQKPKKLFSPEQIKLLHANASPTLRAKILLAMNTGMNNADLGNIQFRHLDLKKSWLDYARHKTGVEREAPLWPETVRAINEYLAVRQSPLSQYEDFVFITKARRSWSHSSLATEFGKLVNLTNAKRDKDGNPIRRPKLKSNGEPIKGKYEYEPVKNPPILHGTFGYFRHTFEPVGGGSRDQVAVNAIMGHADGSMAAEYREDIEDERLEAVARHVRRWLFGAIE
jgi:integrase